MKVFFKRFFLVLFFPFILFADLVDEKFKPKSELLEIFKIYSSIFTDEQCALLPDPTLENLNTIAQDVFLRKPGLERKDLKVSDSPMASVRDESLLGLFRSIGDKGDILPPTRAEYDYILLNGSTVQNMRQRLNALVRMVESEHLKINEKTKIVFLSGDRDLFPEETADVLDNPALFSIDESWVKPEYPKSEAEAARWIWGQSKLPVALRSCNITFVNAPKKEIVDKDGSIKMIRPSTDDTVKTWIEINNPEPGRCFSVSSQPFVNYQTRTIYSIFKQKKLLERGFIVEGGGYDAYKDENFYDNILIYLDNLARRIYTELQIMRN